jgi:hypothetical protein
MFKSAEASVVAARGAASLGDWCPNTVRFIHLVFIGTSRTNLPVKWRHTPVERRSQLYRSGSVTTRISLTSLSSSTELNGAAHKQRYISDYKNSRSHLCSQQEGKKSCVDFVFQTPPSTGNLPEEVLPASSF